MRLQIQIFHPRIKVLVFWWERCRESYPLDRWTQNYLPVDPLPAETGAPLDWLATGIPEEKSFCVRVAC